MKLLGKIFLGLILIIALAVGAAFYFTAGLVGEADDFFARIKAGQASEAYSMLSSEFRNGTSQEQLEAFLERSRLNKTKTVSWGSREVNNNQGLLKGSANLEDGSVFPLEVHFVSENSEWKILGIHKASSGVDDGSNQGGSTINVAANQIVLPAETDQIALVQQALRAFGESVNQKNMTRFHNYISSVWKSQYTVEKLDQAYKGLYGMEGDLTRVSNLSPVFSGPAQLNEQGVMKIAGFFPTKPQQLNFEQKFVREGSGWKLLGLHIKFSAAG